MNPHPYPIAYASWHTWHPWQSQRQARQDRWPAIIEEAYQAYLHNNRMVYQLRVEHHDSNDFDTPVFSDFHIIWHSGQNYSSEGCACLNVIHTFRGAPQPLRRDLDLFYVPHVIDLNVTHIWRPFLREEQLYSSFPVISINQVHRNEIDALYEELEVQLFINELPLPRRFPTFATAQRLRSLSDGEIQDR